MIARPAIEIHDHCCAKTRWGVDAGRLLRSAEAALAHCLRSRGPHEPVLHALESVEVNLVDDAAIAEVHRRFMDLDDPTDVITFHHGEAFVSIETAARRASEFGHSTDREAALYIVHALLHLNGFDDRDDDSAERMRHVQEEILEFVWPAGGAPPGESTPSSRMDPA